MTGPVSLNIEGDVAVILIDNPPVNVTSQAVRAGLVEALDAVETADVARVVLTGAGKAFVAGADAREFSQAPQPPHLPDIVARLERFPVPVVAAINGVALGGGLELALGCHARVASPKATLGLPEVTLGVVPGAGGTQRLPRLIGVAEAVAMISEGKVISADEALRIGIVDVVAEDTVAASRTILLPQRSAVGASLPAADDAAIEAARQQIARKMRRQIAPARAIDLVEAASRLPLSEGLALERATFLELKTSDQAAALRHVFFAERAAMGRGRAGGSEITSAVVVGGGNMGASIAYALAGIGIDIALVEANEDAVVRARVTVGKLYTDAVARGKTTEQAAHTEQDKRFSFHVGYASLPKADLAIEAVFEDVEVKKQVFAALDAALPVTAILATNTSYLDVNRIAESVRHPDRFLGLHFFSPAHIMKLLEVVKGKATSAETMATALRLASRLKKIPVLAGVCDGFIGNRILTRYRQICDVMLLEGALPWQVDAAMRGFGMAMGPYEVQDLSGLDIAYANRKRLGWKTKQDFRYIPIADRVVEETERLGRKTGAGWYDYENGKGSPSSVIETIIIEESARAGIARRTFGDDEIVARATTAMIEEGIRILEDGIAETTADIDLTLVHGYGFPRWRGGPMHLADRQGLAEVARRIGEYAAADPLSWAVPHLLQRLVAENGHLESTGKTHG